MIPRSKKIEYLFAVYAMVVCGGLGMDPISIAKIMFHLFICVKYLNGGFSKSLFVTFTDFCKSCGGVHSMVTHWICDFMIFGNQNTLVIYVKGFRIV